MKFIFYYFFWLVLTAFLSFSSSTFYKIWFLRNDCVCCVDVVFVSYRLASLNYASSNIAVHYSSVSCDGTESGISQCTWSSSTVATHNSDVFVVCWPSNEVYTGELNGCNRSGIEYTYNT